MDFDMHKCATMLLIIIRRKIAEGKQRMRACDSRGRRHREIKQAIAGFSPLINSRGALIAKVASRESQTWQIWREN